MILNWAQMPLGQGWVANVLGGNVLNVDVKLSDGV
jgi:hypothetical protein